MTVPISFYFENEIVPDTIQALMAQLELQCPFCSKTSSRGTGLASHVRGTHPAQYASWQKSRGKTPLPTVSKSEPKTATRGNDTGGGLKDVIGRLEQQHSAIVRALAALRGMEGSGGGESLAAVPAPATAKKKRGMTPEGRARLIAALKRRWAAKKKAAKKS
jgi:hypothetical protein